MKKLIPYVVATALTVMPLASQAKTLLTQVSGHGDATQRVEVLESSHGLEGYMVWEHTDSDFYKARVQTFPLGWGVFRAGASAQHVDGTAFDDRQELGLVGRIKTDDGKLDLGFYPESDTLTGYLFFTSGDITADLLSGYSLASKSGFLRPSIQYDLGPLRAGLEAQTDGQSLDYLGIRLQRQF